MARSHRSHKRLLTIGAVLGGLWLLSRRNAPMASGPTQGQMATNMPAAPMIGPASAPVIPIPANPGGY